MFFINYALKFKYQPDHSKVKYARCNVKHLHYSKVVDIKRKQNLTEDEHFLSFLPSDGEWNFSFPSLFLTIQQTIMH